MKSWDKYDEEASREGNAIKTRIKVHRPLGKRIIKIRKAHDSGNRKIQTRCEKRYVD